MINIYPGLRVVDRYYKATEFPGAGVAWESRHGIVTSIDHPAQRPQKVWVRWDGYEEDREAPLFWLYPEDEDASLESVRHKEWYKSNGPAEAPANQEGDSHEEEQVEQIDFPV